MTHNPIRLPRLLGLAAGVSAALAFTGVRPAAAQMKPEETVKTFQTAEGLETTVWASEPDMSNPTNIDVDSKGRVWVLEAANYRKSITRPEGDRILILEDTKGTGVCDSVKVFYQDKSLFAPLGMHSARPEFDAAGTWVASSYVRASARDFARFGLLYLRDGVWDGTRLLPEGWVDYGRTIESVDPIDGPYGAHWWGVDDDTLGTFRASGYEGQSITICPTLDLIVVRLGKTAAEHYPDLTRWRADMVSAFTRA